MSLLSELEVKKGSTHERKRVGRGHGSGHGKTAAKGHKGQKARTGGKVLRGFEGGQMPLARRIPKFGFKNTNKQKFKILNLKDLNNFDSVSPEDFIAKNSKEKLKILADGELNKAVTVKAHKLSEKAKAAIEAAGGTVEVVE